MEKYKLLGFDTECQTFEEFFQQELLPGMENAETSKISYESTRMLDIPLMGAVMIEVMKNLRGKLLFYTSDGRVGLGPVKMELDDVLYVLDQCKFPIILRRVNGHCLFVGYAYVLGLMHGETASLVEKGEVALQALEVR